MRLGTRRSALALAQAELVAGMLGGVEVVPLSTGGDAGAGAEDKSRWVDGLERALLDGEIDLAVHSAKDLPGELAPGLALLGAPARAGAEDALCGAAGLEALAPGARVGTSSLRRVAQLRSARPDLEVVPVRGNVDTRLAKLGSASERLDAIVLARAGLQRLGREAEAGALLDPARFVPAPGQGALALQGRTEDARAQQAAERITDAAALMALRAERALARALGADCHTALGAHAQAGGGGLLLRGWVGLPDGSAWALDEQAGEPGAPEALGELVAKRLRAVGAQELLEGARETAQAGDAG
jgi:hydroxymethylbilane synthase